MPFDHKLLVSKTGQRRTGRYATSIMPFEHKLLTSAKHDNGALDGTPPPSCL
jgi:hypothetical protein